MGDKSKIEWTERTWNPLAGCTAKSPGCLNCYAATMSARLEAMGQKKYQGVTITRGKRKVFNGLINYSEKALLEPLRWRKPQMVFVNSMSDLFWGEEEDLATARRLGVENPLAVPFEFIDKVFAVMALTPHIKYQLLTKRPERMLEWFNEKWQPGLEQNIGRFHIPAETVGEDRRCQILRAVDDIVTDHKLVDFDSDDIWTPEGSLKVLQFPWPLPNVWLGVSVEDQKTADERIPLLLQTSAAVRWLSVEPLLGPVDLSRWIIERGEFVFCNDCHAKGNIDYWPHDDSSYRCLYCGSPNVGNDREGSEIDWIVAGGESGPDARPMHSDWVRSIRDQCTAAGVAFFFKQWGKWTELDHGPVHRKIYLDSPEYAREAARCDGFMSREGHFITKITDARVGNTPYRGLVKLGKRKAGCTLDGRTWDEMPEVSIG